jgi:alpha-maltose-1-phosphate synthase
MKVLFINENVGGHATVHHHLRRCLSRRPDIDATFLDVAAPSLIRRIAGAPLPALGSLDLDLQPLRAQLALSAWVRRRLPPLIADADVVHLYTQNAGLTSVGLLKQRPCVVSLDTTNARNAYRLPYRAPTRFTPLTIPMSMRAERRVFAAAHTVIANSRWAGESLIDDYGLAPDKVVIQPFGITAPPARERPQSSGRPQIIFIGRQFDRKGGPNLLEAWRRSVRNRADLVLVTMDQVEAEPGVTVIGDLRQGDERLWELLADASILAFPSTIDQAPNAVIEAMAAGRAVIAVPTAGIAEMVLDGVTGRHIPPDDVDALAAALDELVDDHERCAQMGRAGRARFDAVYDADRTTDALIEILRAATGAPTGRHQ